MRWVEWIELYLLDVEFRGLLRHDFRLLSSRHSRDVPNDDDLLFVLNLDIVLHLGLEYLNAGCHKIPAIPRKTHTIQDVDWHVHESDASSRLVVPESEHGILAILARLAGCDQVTLGIEIKAANGRSVPKEESFLFVGLGVHGDHSASRREEDDVLALLLRPPEVKAHVGLVADDVLQFHDRVDIQLVRPGEIVPRKLPTPVLVRSARAGHDASLLLGEGA